MTVVANIVSAQSIVGPSASRWILGATLGFVHVKTTGNPDLIMVRLEGSINNVDWIPIGTILGEDGMIGATDVGLMTQVNLGGFTYIRGNVISITGGSSPTVTVALSSAGSNTYLVNGFNGLSAPSASIPHWIFGATTGGCQVVCTGSPTTALVAMEGSLDGTNWTLLAELNCAPSGAIFEFTVKSMAYVRARLKTLSGGTTPTVSASFSVL